MAIMPRAALSAFLRHAFASTWHRHPHHSAPARPHRCGHHDDLHPRRAAGGPGRSKSPGRPRCVTFLLGLPNFVFDDSESSSTRRPPALPARGRQAQRSSYFPDSESSNTPFILALTTHSRGTPLPYSTRRRVVVKHLARGPLMTRRRQTELIQGFFWPRVVERRAARVLDGCRASSPADTGGFPTLRRRVLLQDVLSDLESQCTLPCCMLRLSA